jgi:hypothetical protein
MGKSVPTHILLEDQRGALWQLDIANNRATRLYHIVFRTAVSKKMKKQWGEKDALTSATPGHAHFKRKLIPDGHVGPDELLCQWGTFGLMN